MRPGIEPGMRPMEDKEFNLEQMEQETEEMLRMNFLSERDAKFSATEGGFVALEYNGEKYPRVQVARMFPFTDPEEYISIRTVGERSKEIGIIKKLSDLSADTRKLLMGQLNLRYFTPVITHVINIKEEYGHAYFDVVTDRGECRFTIRSGGGSVVHLSETRIIISDVDENRFEIPDIMKLSARERKKLDLYL